MANSSQQSDQRARVDDSLPSAYEGEAAGHQEIGENPQFSLQEGRELLQAGRLKEALERLEHTLQQVPNLAQAWELKAAALHGLGHFEKEFEALEHAFLLEGNETVLFSRARCHLALGRSDEALKDLREVLNIGQDETTRTRAESLILGLSPPPQTPGRTFLDSLSGASNSATARVTTFLGDQGRRSLSVLLCILMMCAALWAGFNFQGIKGRKHSVAVGGYSVDILQEQISNSNAWTPQANNFYQNAEEQVLIQFADNGTVQTLIGRDLTVNGQKIFDNSMSGPEILEVLGTPSNVHQIVYFYVFEANDRRWVLELVFLGGKDQPPMISLSPVTGGWEDTKSINLNTWLRKAS